MHQQIEEYLEAVNVEPLFETHSKGFTYFYHGFMPRLLEAGKIKGFDQGLLAGGWTRAGEIYALNGAPNRSIQCLKKALVLNPKKLELLMLLTELLILTGEFHQAYRYINQVIDVEPDDLKLITQRQRIQDDINYDSEPQFRKGNLVWELNEQLAAEQFSTVINTVLDTGMNNIFLLKKLACAFGAVGHNANYLKTWDTIKLLDPTTSLDDADRFYQPLEFQNQ